MINLMHSPDGCFRSAKVLLPSGRIIGRPLNFLFSVEVSKVAKEYPVKDEYGSVPPKEKRRFDNHCEKGKLS